MQRRVARPLGMVLVRDRCPEQRHDAVAQVLVDRTFEAVDALELRAAPPVPTISAAGLALLATALVFASMHVLRRTGSGRR